MPIAPKIEPKHILFVDDDVMSRRAVERMLRTSIPGVHVTCAGDGAQALAVLDREPVDLLITDLAMPVIDGIELLLQVARRRLLVPLLVVTAHATPAAESWALSGGAIECFEKPIRQGPFIRTTRALLFDGHRREPLDVVSLAGIVRLIGVESKTCTLHVSSASAQGLLAFSHGDLVDARQGDQRGVRAALAILEWKDPAITLDPAVRPGSWTIHVSVDELLAQIRRRVGPAALDERDAPPAIHPSLPALPPEFDAEAPEPALEFTEMTDGAEHPPASARVTMPAPMPAPAAVRRPLSRAADREPTPPAAPPGLVAPPSLTARVVSPRTGTPPPVPAPPRVTTPPRRPPGPARTVLSPPRVAAPPLASPTPDEPAAPPPQTAAPPPQTVAPPLASPTPDEPAAPQPQREDPPPREAPAASTFAAPEDADCYQLQDLARELLRVAEFEAAETVLRRALVVRPGDRVVEQNLRVLARRRALRAEGERPRGA